MLTPSMIISNTDQKDGKGQGVGGGGAGHPYERGGDACRLA